MGPGFYLLNPLDLYFPFESFFLFTIPFFVRFLPSLYDFYLGSPKLFLFFLRISTLLRFLSWTPSNPIKFSFLFEIATVRLDDLRLDKLLGIKSEFLGWSMVGGLFFSVCLALYCFVLCVLSVLSVLPVLPVFKPSWYIILILGVVSCCCIGIVVGEGRTVNSCRLLLR